MNTNRDQLADTLCTVRKLKGKLVLNGASLKSPEVVVQSLLTLAARCNTNIRSF
jgi:hypothetical protein